MKQLLNLEVVEETLRNLYTNCIDNAEDFESEIEEYASINAQSICEDMRKYVHQKDTRMDGNFCNIREDWEETPDFIGSEVKPWGKFSDVVKSIDDETISDEDLEKFQKWCLDWFFRAFGTWGLCYNFQTLISEIEYERENEAA